MAETVTVAQINTKRHWANAAARIVRMFRDARRTGATIITLNEISKDQAEAIKAMPGWDIHWEINDDLPGNNWGGNAVAWRTDHWILERGWAMPVEIDYRRGKKSDKRLGPWFKKVIKFACVRLQSAKNRFKVVVQSFHNPTRYNSNAESRQKCVDKSARFAAGRIKRGIAVILGGDGNNIFAKTTGLRFMGREGPDAILSNGSPVRRLVLQFKTKRLSDHNGLLAAAKFRFIEGVAA